MYTAIYDGMRLVAEERHDISRIIAKAKKLSREIGRPLAVIVREHHDCLRVTPDGTLWRDGRKIEGEIT